MRDKDQAEATEYTGELDVSEVTRLLADKPIGSVKLAKSSPIRREESRKVTTYEPFPEGPPENWPTEYVSLDSYEALQAVNEKLVEDLQEMDFTDSDREQWEQEHVESWTRLLERAERCLADDPDADTSSVVARDIRASIAAGTRMDDASRIRPTDGPPRATERLTHGRHCVCSACAAQDWGEPGLAHCGMHGPSCPPVYAPLGGAGEPVD